MKDVRTVSMHCERKYVNTDCPSCGFSDVLTSRHRGIESVVVKLLPVNICRCVSCFRRFWVFESLFANATRVFIWGLFLAVIVSITLLTFLQSQPVFEVPNPNVRLGGQVENQSEEEPSSFVLPSHDSGAVLAQKNETFLLKKDEPERENEAQSKANSTPEKEAKEIVNSKVDLESLARTEMQYNVDIWKKMWELGLVNDYLSFYSSDFEPNNFLSVNEWVDQRKKRVTPEKKIRLELNNFDLSFSDNMSKTVMEFDQVYISQTYSGTSRKQLVWEKEINEWKIVSEKELENFN